jgi:Protein of unknwon function (DUF3310).
MANSETFGGAALMSEEVNHPAHYQLQGGVEVIDLVEHLSFNIGNAIKYLCRAGNKPGVDLMTDLKKARWYIDREMERIARQNADLEGRLEK